MSLKRDGTTMSVRAQCHDHGGMNKEANRGGGGGGRGRQVHVNTRGVRMSEQHAAMHAASHYGNTLDAGSEEALTSAWKHDRLFVTNEGLYRRLLYFANLLLCSAAILKEEYRESKVWTEGLERDRGEHERRKKEEKSWLVLKCHSWNR